MNFKSLVIAGCLFGFSSFNPSFAQITTPNDAGDIFRAEALNDVENFLGASDQLRLINPAALSPDQFEQAAWLECVSSSRLNIARAKELLAEFVNNYGASHLRFKALMLLADCTLLENPAEALLLYNQVNPDAVDRASLAYHKGYALLCDGRTDLAKPLFIDASRESEWKSKARFYLAYIDYCNKDYAAAKAVFEKCDRSQMPGKLADFYLAQIYYATGDYRMALNAALNTLNQSPLNPEYSAEATRIAGESYFHLNDTKKAVEYLRAYTSRTASPARSAVYILGFCDFNSAKFDSALRLLQQVTEADDSDATAQNAYLLIGQILFSRGDNDAALVAFDKALKMDFDSAVQEAAFYNYAVAKSSGARVPFAPSIAVYEEYLAKFPDGAHAPLVREFIIESYLNNNDFEGALQSINRMPNPSQKVLDAKKKVLYALGSRALAAGNTDKAVSYLREADVLKSTDKATDAQLNLLLGEALARKGSHSEAVAHFNKYFSLAPADDVNRSIGRLDLAYSYFALKKYEDAAKNFSSIADIDLTSDNARNTALRAEILNRIADSYLYLNKYDDALQKYLKAYLTYPSAGDYPLFQTAVIHGYQRRYNEKINTIEKLIAEFPSSSLVPDALLEMTESYIQLGRYDDAISTYRRLVAEFPATEQGRRGYIQLALTLLNSGRRAEAINAYKDVVTLYPSSEEASMALEELNRIYADDGQLDRFAAWLSTVDGAPALNVDETDSLTFEAAERAWLTEKNPERMQTYLSRFPDGKFRVRALSYLLEDVSHKGDFDAIVELSDEIVTRYADSSYAEAALFARADAFTALNRSKEALETWETLETRASSPAMLRAARLGIMRQASLVADYPRVIAATDALLASSSLGTGVSNEVRFYQANAFANTGRRAEALDIWQQLAANPDDLFGARSAFSLAELHFNEGNLPEARARVEALIDSATPHSYWLARGFILLSDIYRREGKDFEAREYLKSLRENYPGSDADIFEMIDSRLNR